jgi:hypothetical protein
VLKHFSPLAAGSLLCAVSVLSSCGGSSGGNDKDFVTDLCHAATDLRGGIQQAIKEGSTSTDANKTVDLISAPIDQFVKDFADARPPKDLKEWHDGASQQLQQTAQNFKQQNTLAALTDFGHSPVPDPPAAAKARLEDVAKSVPDCNGVAFLKPD